MRSLSSSLIGLASALIVLSASCSNAPPAVGSASGKSSASASVSTSTAVASASAAADQSRALENAKREEEARKARFAELANDLSEPDAEFFSDNFISNETSYLQVAKNLAKRAKQDGVYIGVGPEQNFTYIALSKPRLAFIVDIRRQNLLLHLLYKAAFEEASSRAHFLSLMLGRAHEAANDGSAADGVDAVLANVAKDKFDAASYKAAHETLMKRVEGYGVTLSADDKKHLEATHKAFFDGQLELKFSLKSNNGRAYPTLREILGAKSPEGSQEGFLATEESFRFLQTMEKEHRIIPLVGDFAGEKAMPGLAAYLTKENLVVSSYYVSNVEQYLLDPKPWEAWKRNVKALPKDDSSLYIRAYLDQGKKHPKELKGQRTATVLQSMKDFDQVFGPKKSATLYDISTTNVLD
ncbi:MAG: hypothetical protein U0414_05455 [Polyangiaceae bacterium]